MNPDLLCSLDHQIAFSNRFMSKTQLVHVCFFDPKIELITIPKRSTYFVGQQSRLSTANCSDGHKSLGATDVLELNWASLKLESQRMLSRV